MDGLLFQMLLYLLLIEIMKIALKSINEANLSAQLWGQDPYASPGTYSWVPDVDVFQGYSKLLDGGYG